MASYTHRRVTVTREEWHLPFSDYGGHGGAIGEGRGDLRGGAAA